MARKSNNRITLFNNGRTTVLCDWTDTVHDEEILPGIAIQVVKYFRGPSAAFARGNDVTTLTFTVCREWPSIKAAWDAWINCRTLVPVSGDLAWISRSNSEGSLSRYLASCVVQVQPLQRLGKANYIQYACIGPAITTTPPSSIAAA